MSGGHDGVIAGRRPEEPGRGKPKLGIRLLALVAFVVLVCGAAITTVPRAQIETLERHFDRRLQSFDVNDPFYILGATRGVYLDGYGMVFTSEVGLVQTPNITPFRPQISKEDIAKVRQRKLARVPQVKKLMRDMLVQSGNVLVTMPADQQVVIAMIMAYSPWEDKTGLPLQIMMQAQRKTLVDFEAGRMDEAGLVSAIKVQEF
jgi:hypothetical protein